MAGLEHYLHESGLEESLIHLIKLRASQINGCAYRIDMHWKDLKAVGESDQRLYELSVWGGGSVLYRSRARGPGTGPKPSQAWPKLTCPTKSTKPRAGTLAKKN